MGEGERRSGEGGRCAPTALSQVGQTCNSSFAEQNNCIHGIINTQASFFSLVPKPPFFFLFVLWFVFNVSTSWGGVLVGTRV